MQRSAVGRVLEIESRQYAYADLPGAIGSDLGRFPWVFRVLLENTLRHHGADAATTLDALRGWLVTGTSTAEIAFTPSRVLMHDTTCVPALVDIAGMRDALAEAGEDPSCSTRPAGRCIGRPFRGRRPIRQPHALAHNMERELRRNVERYRFMKWATRSLQGVRVHPPGTGIMHTINLERLATVVATEERDGAYLGDPRYSGWDGQPYANGQWHRRSGLGRRRAGGRKRDVRHAGHASDTGRDRRASVRRVTRRACLRPISRSRSREHLRRRGMSGEFVEFYGPGVASLSAGERCRRRQHGAGIWRFDRLFPHRPADASLPARDRTR